jgi:transcriptional regulator with XRE-family HTH domain
MPSSDHMAPIRDRHAEIFADRVRELLDKKRHVDGKRWTQKDLADAVGAMPNTVNGWLNRGVLPPLPTRKVIAQVLGVPIEFLEGETDDPGMVQKNASRIDLAHREAFTPNPAFRRRLPPRAYALAYSYLQKLEPVLNHDELAEVERFLVDAAFNKLNSSDRRERTEDDMVKDLRAAWVFVKDVLGERAADLD